MRDLAAPAAAGGEPRLEPQLADRAARAGGMGEQPLDQQSPSARSSCWPEAASGSPSRDSISSRRPARAQRLVAAAGEPQRAQPELAEAIGDAVGGQRRELAQGADPEPLERVDAARLLGLPLAGAAVGATR